MAIREHGYILTYRVVGKTRELAISIKPPNGEGYKLAWLRGRKNADIVFSNIVRNTNASAGLTLLKSSPRETIYLVREDLGPILATYIILNRGSPDPRKWSWFLKEVLSGKLSDIGDVLTSLLKLALRLSSKLGAEDGGASPEALDIISAGLKEIVSRMRNLMK